MHAFSSRNILSAPNLDLLDVAPMSLCRVDLVVEDDIDVIDSLAKSKTDNAGDLSAIIALALVIHLE